MLGWTSSPRSPCWEQCCRLTRPHLQKNAELDGKLPASALPALWARSSHDGGARLPPLGRDDRDITTTQNRMESGATPPNGSPTWGSSRKTLGQAGSHGKAASVSFATTLARQLAHVRGIPAWQCGSWMVFLLVPSPTRRLAGGWHAVDKDVARPSFRLPSARHQRTASVTQRFPAISCIGLCSHRLSPETQPPRCLSISGTTCLPSAPSSRVLTPGTLVRLLPPHIGCPSLQTY